ncbi:hypothetical protein, partial [Streptomyces sp. NPDC058872]|uniref:hypothetical protein n=1 Tax=Streptomyces sp. NPDC058872 TaxID=3346661 RepID=UPI003682E965
MTDYLRDAQLIHRATQERLTQKTTERQAQGKRGSGQPGAEHSALNRAVVVAAVGALEAFTEDLAITAQEHYPPANTPVWFRDLVATLAGNGYGHRVIIGWCVDKR